MKNAVATKPTLECVSASTFRAGMRHLAAGVCLVTTSHAGERHGFAATSVSGLSADPPSLLVCVNRATSSHDPLHGSGRFCVNVLGERHQPLVGRFSDPERRHERFGDDIWEGHDGLALAGALAAFECRLDQVIPYGSHTIAIGLIETIRLTPEAGEPLLYFDARFRALAAP